MSKLIQTLLQQKDPMFVLNISRLEKLTGVQGIDVRLTADILSQTRHKITELGFDPNDTTGKELYAGLLQKARESDEYLRAYLGHPANGDAASRAAIGAIEEILKQPETWALKHTVLKSVLKKNPPKKVMKAFHFQSVDSLVKRMHVCEIIMAARVLESNTWHQKLGKYYAQTTIKDFEKTKFRLIVLEDSRWIEVLSVWQNRTGHMVIQAKECGAVGFYISGQKGSYFTSIPLVLHAVNEVLLHGCFFKLHMVNPSVGLALVDGLNEGEMIHTSITGVKIHWRDLQRYFGTYHSSGDISVGHIDSNDLGWLKVEIELALECPQLSYWVGNEYLGIVYGPERIISMNIHDVALSYSNQLPYEAMYTKYLRRSLKSELMSRYIQIPAARALAIRQFDFSDTTEENW